MEIKNLILILVTLILGTGGLFGCVDKSPGTDSKGHKAEQRASRRIIVYGIDETGSYNLWNHAKISAAQIIQQLEPGDIFYCRRITDASYLDENTIFRLEISTQMASRNENIFDRKARSINRIQANHIKILKKDAVNRLMDSKFIKAKNTDIWGYLSAASDRYGLVTDEFQRILIIASDLKDNVGYNVKLDLTNVYVAVYGFQVSKNPGETQRLKDKWISSFTEAGAAKVVFLAVEEKLSLELLKGP